MDQNEEIGSAVGELSNILAKSDSVKHLIGLKLRLVELRSTEDELENVERQHKLGYIKSEDYLLRHDQLNLRKNTLLEEIKEQNLIPIIETVKKTDSKSRLRKIADSVVSYKDAIKALAEMGGAFLKGLLTG